METTLELYNFETEAYDEIRLRGSVIATMYYKTHFKAEPLAEMLKLNKTLELTGKNADNLTEEDLAKFDLDVFYKLLYVFAKAVNPHLEEPTKFFSKYEIPLEHAPVVFDILLSSLTSSKKKIATTAKPRA